MANDIKILVYHHQPSPNAEPIVRKGLGVMRWSELDAALSEATRTLQLGKKFISPRATHVEITPRDLLTPPQLADRSRKPNDDSSIASVRVPMMAYLNLQGYKELWIVSRKQEESPVEHALGKI